MFVYRLQRKKYASILNGKGAAKSNNRWNSKGVEMIYTADSRALAMAEVVVHLSLSILPKDFQMMEIEIPDTIKMETLNIKKLNLDWNNHPATSQTQRMGDAFIDSAKAFLFKVPSAVVKGDSNILLNPNSKKIG